MASITSTLGVGSGLDTTALVTGLVSASYDPKIEAQTKKEAANTAKISTLASLSNGLDAFSTALNTLISGGTLKTQPTTSDASVLMAKTKTGVNLGTLAEQVEVRQLAQAQSLVSAYVAGSTTPVGLGDLTLTVGGVAKTITIDGTNNSLAGLARAINAAGAGVTATVVNDATGSRLAIKGETGADKSFTLVADPDADASLQDFTYGDGGTEMVRAQEAKDVIIRKDGIDVTRSTNTIEDLIPGVTLTLLGAKPGTSIAIGSQRPTEAITQAVNDFVAAFNEFRTQLKQATSAGTAGGEAGALYGHAAARAMERELSRLASTKLQTGDGPQTLAEIGVSTGRDGTLSVNAAALTRALTASPDAVEAMFNPTQRSSNPLISVVSGMGATKPGTYTVANIVAGTDSTNASGMIDGRVGLPSSGGRLYASSATSAKGLILLPLGNVTSATITVDAGLGGALQAIRDGLSKTNGPIDSLEEQFASDQRRLADARLKLEAQRDAYKDQLTGNFTRMETQVAAFKATQSYLTQQIAMWTRQN